MDDAVMTRFLRGEPASSPHGEPPPPLPLPPPPPGPPTELERTEQPPTAAATVPPSADGAAAAGTQGGVGVFGRLMAAQQAPTRPSKTAKSAKAAFKAAKKCACNAQCLREFEDFKRRNAAKAHPGRGFKHHATCPKKQAADAMRGPH